MCGVSILRYPHTNKDNPEANRPRVQASVWVLPSLYSRWPTQTRVSWQREGFRITKIERDGHPLVIGRQMTSPAAELRSSNGQTKLTWSGILQIKVEREATGRVRFYLEHCK